MRFVDLQPKKINGLQLEAELRAAGVPVGYRGIMVVGDVVRVVLPSLLPGDFSQDDTVAAVYAAHTPPPEKTPAEVSRDEVLADLDTDSSKYGVLIRTALRMVNASLNQVRQALGQPQVSWAQVKQQFAQLVAAGGGDPETSKPTEKPIGGNS